MGNAAGARFADVRLIFTRMRRFLATSAISEVMRYVTDWTGTARDLPRIEAYIAGEIARH